MLVSANRVARAHALVALRELQRRNVQKRFHLCCQSRQHRLQGEAQQTEGLDAGAAHIVQAGVLAFQLGQLPRLVSVHVFVHAIGQGHGVAQGFGAVAVVQQRFDGWQACVQLGQQRFAIGANRAELAAKALGYETCRTAGDVDVLAHQIRVDACQKIVGVEVDVFIATIELGSQVVAQPLGVHAEFQVLQRVQTGAAALAHLLAVVHGEETMDKYFVGNFAAAELQNGRPKQGVKRDDVFADEVVLLGVVSGHVLVKAASFTVLSLGPALIKPVFQRRQIANGGV